MSSVLALGARLGVQRAALWAMAARGDDVARLLSAPWRGNPYPVYGRLRNGPGVHRSKTGVTVVASHELCSKVLRDRTFGVRTADGLQPPPFVASGLSGEVPVIPSFLELDPPDHTRLRALARPAFSPAKIEGYRGSVAVTASKLLLPLAFDDQFDLMAEFAGPLPITVISALLDIPDVDAQVFARYGRVLGASLDGVRSVRHALAVRRANRELRALFTRLITERRADPGDDVISVLAASDELTDLELATTCELLLVAGYETTTNLIGNAVWAFARHPDQWERLRADEALIGPAVDEVLRYEAPVQATARIAHEDTEIGGVPVAKDGMVVVLIGAAGRDPAAFDRPDEFDIGRGRTDHLAFSSGAHYCLGAPLARLEAEVALRKLVEWLPELVVSGTPRWRPTTVIRGLRSLRLYQ
ncbi:cytochrome P450 [Actinokineospora baliensis]|uniref:cytochrome P450 n=1 Tax=Actinokineospora baliensis TaxID=547056 RepID=UPI00195C890D|nr:cytochrome P450 [Actinokineospora baliensis]MBM7770492.1 cytochrome P450 [Actinokineospora baliensis]